MAADDKKPPELEKEALAAILFRQKRRADGAVDWKRSSVMFPYDRFAVKQTLSARPQSIEAWNLNPNQQRT